MNTRNTIYKLSPVLRTEGQARALCVELQVLGDLCGIGINYFDFDNVGT